MGIIFWVGSDLAAQNQPEHHITIRIKGFPKALRTAFRWYDL